MPDVAKAIAVVAGVFEITPLRAASEGMAPDEIGLREGWTVNGLSGCAFVFNDFLMG